ncbi:SNF1-related protein kinase regulatory subunit beta-2-like isoform X2 [Gossypium raimondii]|uniref:SNF1-related protein kinase regulatory subunit beta-2-like isoform X2 n=1 Tax=Gossypium raimondii TaxID=29730 RepID=UPI00227B369D|nr:SNF1-related protein kinase regulatory subunit beta-2-like isoform X2 [Gossypium raimondii]
MPVRCEAISTTLVSPKSTGDFWSIWSRTSSGSSFIQISEAPLLRPGQMMQIRNHPLVQKSTRYKDFHQEQKRAVMITWCFGGKRVAITGSWDNWKTIEPLHSLGKDFIIMKMFPFGVYHYSL